MGGGYQPQALALLSVPCVRAGRSTPTQAQAACRRPALSPAASWTGEAVPHAPAPPFPESQHQPNALPAVCQATPAQGPRGPCCTGLEERGHGSSARHKGRAQSCRCAAEQSGRVMPGSREQRCLHSPCHKVLQEQRPRTPAPSLPACGDSAIHQSPCLPSWVVHAGRDL